MTAQRYSRSAIFLHWAIALAIAFQLALGWRLESIPKGPGLFAAFQLHKSVGIAILLLTLVRCAIRMLQPPPKMTGDNIWAARLARAVHVLFYGVLLLGPLTGWILVSTARIKVPTLIFGVLPWPHLPVPRSWHEGAEGLHAAIAWIGLGLFFLHVVGALRHQFFKNENILGRMVPFLAAGPIGKGRAAVGAVLAIFAVWAAHGAGWQLSFPSPQVPQDALMPTARTEPEPLLVTNIAALPEIATVEKGTASQPLSDWRVMPGGHLGFTASWTGSPVNGSFSRWESAIRFSPDEPEKTIIRVSIDLGSANTGDSQRDETLASADFFNTAVYPKAIFTAHGVRALGNDRYQARGSLDFHGKRLPVSLDFRLNISDDVARVSGTTRLDRTAFGVGSNDWAATDQIAANVAVAFRFTAKRQSAN